MAAQSARSLRAKLQHAERRIGELEEHAMQLLEDNRAIKEKLAEAEGERDVNDRLYRSAADARRTAVTERDEAFKELSEVREQLRMTQWTLRGVETERAQARIHAETMRERAFPTPPEFPWEKPEFQEVRVHPHDFQNGRPF